jgi:Ca2+-binding RTX toxin-like protein
MVTFVTVPGANNTNIVNAFSNTANTTLAQAISTFLFSAKNLNILDIQNPPPPTPTAPPTGTVGEIQVTTPGAQNTYVQVPSGFSVTAIDQSATGNFFIQGGGSLFVGDQNVTYLGTSASGAVNIAAGNGADYFNLPAGSNFNIALGNGNDTVVANGSGTITGGTGASTFTLGATGSSDVLNSYGAMDTITAAAGNVTVTTYGANPLVYGGTGNLSYIGEAPGNPTITGGYAGGKETLFGGAGQNLTYLDSPYGTAKGSTFLAAGTGNETLNAGGASEGVGIAASSGSADLIGSTGADTFYGGAGSATMAGHGASGVDDVYVFGNTTGHTGGNTIITDFNSSDTFLLSGYGSNAAANAFAGAAVSGSGSSLVSVVTLSDGTKITFAGINTTTGTWNTQSY